MDNAGSVFPGKSLSTVAFRFGSTADDSCTAIAAMPTTPQFTREMIDCVEASFGFGAFDLFAISSFSKSLSAETKTIIDTFQLAFEHHAVRDVILFRHMDVVKPGENRRFKSQSAEDLYHKEKLLKAGNQILGVHPDINVNMVYARLVDNESRILFSDVLPDLQERVRMYAPYRYQGVYQCDTAVLMCMDRKFRREIRHCVRFSMKHDKFALIGLPGASKLLVDGSEAAWREVKRVFQTYGCKRLVIIHHSDCGAYGGIQQFCGDVIAEEFMHRAQIDLLSDMVKGRYPGVEVEKVYARLIDDNEKIEFVQFD